MVKLAMGGQPERDLHTHQLRQHGLDPIATVHGVGYKAAELATDP